MLFTSIVDNMVEKTDNNNVINNLSICVFFEYNNASLLPFASKVPAKLAVHYPMKSKLPGCDYRFCIEFLYDSLSLAIGQRRKNFFIRDKVDKRDRIF